MPFRRRLLYLLTVPALDIDRKVRGAWSSTLPDGGNSCHYIRRIVYPYSLEATPVLKDTTMANALTPLRGPEYLREGWQRIRQPGLRRFLIIPLILNLTLFVALIGWGARQFNYWMDRLMPHLPEWAGFIGWLLWPLFALVVLLVLFFGFSIVANLIASPFYGFLAEKIAEQERGLVSPPTGWREILMVAPLSLGREFRKIGYYLP